MEPYRAALCHPSGSGAAALPALGFDVPSDVAFRAKTGAETGSAHGARQNHPEKIRDAETGSRAGKTRGREIRSLVMAGGRQRGGALHAERIDRKRTRLNSSHSSI